MSYPNLKTWIAGAAETSDVELSDELFDPNTSEPLQQLRASSTVQADRAIDAATRVHSSGEWRLLSARDRAAGLESFAVQLESIVEEVARLDAINSGVPIAVTRLFAGSMADTVRSAAARVVEAGDSRMLPAQGRIVRLRKEPWGPSALILPWNAPSAMVVKKLAYCLAAGATAVIKPSSASPWSAQLVVQAAHEAGIPPGAVNMVLGGREIGQQLVGDPRIRSVSMTGGTSTGKSIAVTAGANLTRLQLELGSNNAAIVRSDADISATGESLAAGAMKLSGQWCEAPRRVLVDRSIFPQVVESLAESLAAMRLGSSLDEDTQVGPVAFRARRDELRGLLEQLVASGAQAIEAGPIPDAGWFISPTVISGESIDLQQELFGPMVTVQPTDGDEHAIMLANRGQHGLAGYVYSEDLDEAMKVGSRLVAGEVKLNGSSVLDLAENSEQSFFADSGIGGHGDAGLLEFFRGTQVIGLDTPGLPI